MSPPGSGSLESLRELNRLRVIETLRRHGVVSRAEIARQTGLSRSTVSSLVADLQAAGLVVERHDDESLARGVHTGRPPVLISLDASAGVALGIDFGHQHLRVAVADLSSRVLAEADREIDVDHAAVEGLDAAAEMVDEVLDEAGVERARVLGAGMGIPGPIGPHSKTMLSPTILPGWVGVNPEAEMRERIGVPVFAENDANLGALAESAFGGGRGVAHMIYLKMSSGIGAGLILGGRLYRGGGGIAGEIGHVLVDERGDLCRCGNRGCLETFAAGPALCEMMRRSRGEAVSMHELIALAHSGDAGAQRVITDAGRVVGRAVAGLCNQLNPDLVVVGGSLSGAGDLLLEPVREGVRRYAVPAVADGARVVAGVLGERAEVLGALALVINRADPAFSPSLATAREVHVP